MDLFRREVVEGSADRLSGEVLLANPLSAKVISAVLALIVLAGATFLSSASFARIETVAGWLVPPGGLIRAQVRQPGVLEQLQVKEGDNVTVGQPLGIVALSSSSNEGDTGHVLAAELRSEAAAARAQVKATLDKLVAEQNDLQPKRGFLVQQIAEIKSQIDLQEQQVTVATRDLSGMQELLDKGLSTRREIDGRQTTLLTAQQTLSTLRGNILASRQQVSDIDARLHQIPADIAKVDADAASASAQLAEKSTENEAQRTYIATASVGGRILAIPVELGQTLAAGQTIAIIMPKNVHLEAELYVPSRSAGFIRAGQGVRLMYEAFPFEKFGTSKGVVTSISRTVLAPSEISVPGLNLQQPIFRVRATLEDESVRAYGEAIPLQPGMLLTADIVFDRRTLLQWLLDPLYAIGRRK